MALLFLLLERGEVIFSLNYRLCHNILDLKSGENGVHLYFAAFLAGAL